MTTDLARSVSSFTIIKGALIEPTYTIFQHWDHSLTLSENIRRIHEENRFAGTSEGWAVMVGRAIRRLYDPSSRDRPLVELAKANCDLEVWRPLLLWHMTRNEFLLRDFLVNWLYPQYQQGALRLHLTEVQAYLDTLKKKKNVIWSGAWTDSTRSRVAAGLLAIARDFGLLRGKVKKEFASYHLPEESFLYLLHAMAERQPNARRLVESEDWHLFLMDASDVEHQLLRLHQFHRLGYETAGSLAQLQLPSPDLATFVKDRTS